MRVVARFKAPKREDCYGYENFDTQQAKDAQQRVANWDEVECVAFYQERIAFEFDEDGRRFEGEARDDSVPVIECQGIDRSEDHGQAAGSVDVGP